MKRDVIIACDFAGREETLRFLDQFENEKPFVKIGMELFYGEGPQIVREIKARGHEVFLDLKLHDIPNTVKKAMRNLAALGADMVNLHAALVAQRLELPMCYVRGSAKDHGRNNRIEGRVEAGQKAVVIEDLISTGGSVVEVVEALREAGAEVLGIASIFSYGMQRGLERLAAARVKNISLSDFDALCEVASEEGYIQKSDIERLLAFRANPSDESWMRKA